MWKSSITTEVSKMPRNGMRPIHPGEVIREDFMVPLGLSANALAKALHVSTPRINDVVRGRRGVSELAVGKKIVREISPFAA